MVTGINRAHVLRCHRYFSLSRRQETYNTKQRQIGIFKLDHSEGTWMRKGCLQRPTQCKFTLPLWLDWPMPPKGRWIPAASQTSNCCIAQFTPLMRYGEQNHMGEELIEVALHNYYHKHLLYYERPFGMCSQYYWLVHLQCTLDSVVYPFQLFVLSVFFYVFTLM